MKVILLEDIEGLGKKFEVKEVKDGYARNFLMPKNLAKLATEKGLKILSQQKAAWERQEKELMEQLEKTAERLKNINLDFYLRVGLAPEPRTEKSKKTFGSISELNIKKALENLGYQNFEILLEKPIKELGEHWVEINLGKGIKSKIKVRVHSQS